MTVEHAGPRAFGRAWPLRRLGPSAAELELLRAALLDGGAAIAAWRRWRADRDPVRAPMPERLLLPAVLTALPASVIGERDRATMAEARRIAWAESEALWAGFRRFLDIVTPLDVDPLVIKGASPTLRAGCGPGTRAISDVDVVVPPERFGEVLDICAGHGWRRGSHLDPWSHGVTLVAPDDRPIDVHRWIAFPRYAERPQLAWIERATVLDERGRPIRVLAPADELVLAVVHGLSSRGVPAARWPLDVSTILRTETDEAFWDRVVGSALDAGLALPVGRGLELCASELAIHVPAATVARLSRSVTTADRLRSATSRVRNNPPGLWTRYRRVASAQGRRPSVPDFAAARWDRLRSQGGGAAVRDGLARTMTRLANDVRR